MPRPKLQNRDRFPSGQAKPDNSDPVTRIRNIITVARRDAPILDGPVGRLHLLRELTAEHVAGADHYARLRARYDAVKGFPRRTVASPAYEVFARSSPASDDPRRVDQSIRRYETLRQVIGPNAAALLDRVVICNEEPPLWERQALAIALAMVATWAGIGGKRRAA